MFLSQGLCTHLWWLEIYLVFSTLSTLPITITGFYFIFLFYLFIYFWTHSYSMQPLVGLEFTMPTALVITHRDTFSSALQVLRLMAFTIRFDQLPDFDHSDITIFFTGVYLDFLLLTCWLIAFSIRVQVPRICFIFPPESLPDHADRCSRNVAKWKND